MSQKRPLALPARRTSKKPRYDRLPLSLERLELRDNPSYGFVGGTADPTLDLTDNNNLLVTGAVVALEPSKSNPTAAIGLGGKKFNFAGVEYGTAYVSYNGLITFGSPSDQSGNAPLNSTLSMEQAAVAPLWNTWFSTDRYPSKGVVYQLDTANNKLIVQWDRMEDSTAASDITFQAVLSLETGITPGNIVFNYLDLDTANAATANGKSATVGVKDANPGPNTPAELFTQVSHNALNANVQGGKSITLNWVNTAPQNVTLTPSAAIINENDTLTLGGSFTDPNKIDTHTITINWGDGTPDTVLNPAKGVKAFAGLTHQYLDNPNLLTQPNSKYTITATVVDSQGGTTAQTALVQVNNVTPTVTIGGDATINEGGSFARTGSFADPGTLDGTWTAEVDFGDGTTKQPLTLTGKNFDLNHTYADQGKYTVTVYTRDKDGATGQAALFVTVNNVLPTVTLDAGLGSPTVSEGTELVLNSIATYTDPGLTVGEVQSWSINWGDGTTESKALPGNPGLIDGRHTFADNGTYTVTVSVLDNVGPAVTKSFQVTVNNVVPTTTLNPALATPQPVAEGGTLTIADLATFTDPGYDNAQNPNAVPGGSRETFTYTVNWGDGTSNTVGTPLITQVGSAGIATAGKLGASHVYADDGLYTVTVTVTDDDGGTSTPRTFQVQVGNVNPVITTPVTNRGVNEGAVLTIASPASFTDAGYTNLSNPLQAGGSKETFTYTINWGDGTTTDSGTVTNVTQGSAGVLTAGSIGSVEHVFADDGVYTVTVTITDDNGGSASQNFNVTVGNVAPTLTVAADRSVNEGNSLALPTAATFTDPGFNNPLNPAGATVESFTYEVNWGDGTTTQSGPITAVTPGSPGTPTTGSLNNLSHVYADDGVYTVSVKITDDNGGTTTRSFQVTVNNVAPTIGTIAGDTSVAEGATLSVTNVVSFSDPGFDNPLNPTGGTVERFTYSINWGDGTTPDAGPVTAFTSGSNGVATVGSLSNASHTYADDGVYTVAVTITDDNGGTATRTFQVVVTNVAPTVTPTTAKTIDEGAVLSVPNMVTFTDPGFNNPLNPAGASVESFTYSVNWGDGTPLQTGTVPNVTPGSVGTPTSGFLNGSHTYADDGLYTVSVTITDDNGGTTTRSFPVTVSNVAPTVVISGNKTVTEGQFLSVPNLVTFTDPGFDNPLNPAGATVERFAYSVNWGDGTGLESGTVPNVTPGGVGVLTTGFLDGSHTYADDGLYTVTVTITDDNGGMTTQTLQVLVNNVAPTVTAAANQTVNEGTLLSVPNLATFTDPGFDNPALLTVESFTYAINWGDGTAVQTGTVPNVTPGSVGMTTSGFLNGSHTYADNGTYTVSVTITDDNGGATTKAFQVTVNNTAPVVAVVGNQTIAEGAVLAIANVATWTDAGFNNAANPNQQPGGSNESFTYSINWGDGTTTDGGTVAAANVTQGSAGVATTGFQNASHTYADNGTYTVTVTITDDDGAAVVKTFNVAVGNTAPTLVRVANSLTAAEGGLVALPTLATLSDPGYHNGANPNQQPGGSRETFTYTINWGDGSTETKAVTNFTTGSAGSVSAGAFGGSHTYADNGTYAVTATVLDDDTGLSNVVSLTVTVTNVAPTLNVAAAQTVVEGAVLDLLPVATFSDPGFNNATGTPATAETFTYVVNWGDGSADATGAATVTQAGFAGSPTLGAVAANHVYADDGTYTVTVTITDDDGGATTRTFTVTVANSAPTLSVVAPQTFAEGQTFTLPTVGTLRDAGFANGANPNGASAETFTYTINWGDGTTPDTGSAALTQLGSAGVQTLASFGGGHTFDRVGTFNVVVRVTDDNGGFDEKTFPVTVTNVAPTLTLTNANRVGTEGTTVTLPSVGTFTDPGFSPTETFSYRVEWGDGAVSTGPAAVSQLGSVGVLTQGGFGAAHAYGDNGLYTVRVVLADSNGGTSEGSFQIQVGNVAPTLTLNVGPTVTTPEGSQLALPNLASFSDPGFGIGETFTYAINWGDGTTSSGKASLFQVGGADQPALGSFGEAHTYAENGTYPVTVTLTDKDGGTSTKTFTVDAINVAPTNLVYTLTPATATEGAVVELEGSFTDPGLFDPHTVTVDWGDGSAPATFTLLPGVTYFNTRNVGGNFLTHTYAQNSTGAGYPVTVTVTDDAGLSNTKPAALVVTNVAPTVTLSTPQKVTKDVRFVVASTVSDPGVRDTLTYFWQVFGPDGQRLATATTQDLEYTATNPGTHRVSLTVTDSDGGATTQTASIRVQNGQIFAIAADSGGGPRVALFDAKSQTRTTDFYAYEPTYTGGVRVAVGDVRGDGTADIITATGVGGGPRVRVIDSVTQEVIADYFAYEDTYRGGMFLAVGDVDGDGFDDIATAPDAGGGPRVKVVSGKSLQTIYDDFVFAPDLRNGVRIGVNDVNGDGFADVVVGSGPGVAARVRVIDVHNGRAIYDQNVIAPDFTGGVYVAAGDVDGDGHSDIIVGPGVGGAPIVRAIDAITTRQIAEYQPYESSYTGGVRVAAVDYDGDGRADVVTGTGPGGGPSHRIWKPFTGDVLESFFSFEDTFQGGVYVGAGD